MQKLDLSLIVAMTLGTRIIGRGDEIPWRLPSDMKRFAEITKAEKVVIMGRKTWDSLPERFKPLPDRHNIVITRNGPLWPGNSVEFVNSPDQALAAAKELGTTACVMGGAEIYRLFLPHVSRMYVTLVQPPNEAALGGDVFFPEVKLDAWKCALRTRNQQVPDKDEFPFWYETWERGF